MPVKNTVTVERRTDLASLFCMIGRHGPAVALAVIAMVSVVAGFIFYRNVRGKRKKATVGDAAATGAERDASVAGTEEETELSESTDTGDESSSSMAVEPDLIQSGPGIRHRRAPSAEKTPTSCLPQTEFSAVEDCSRVAEMHDEDLHILQGDLTSATAAGVKDEDDYCHSLTEDTATNVEPDYNIECSPELVYKETPANYVKVFQETCEEDRNTITEDVSQGITSKEENLERASDSPLCSELQIPMSENINDLPIQEGSDTSSYLEAQIVQTEEISDLQTSEVEESPLCVSSYPLCFEQDPVSETCDILPESGATPDINGQSDEQIGYMGDDENVFDSEDLQISENDKVQVSEVTPNGVNSLEGQIIDVKVSDVVGQEENFQSASRSPVCADQDVNVDESGNDIGPQICEMTSSPNSNVEEPVHVEDVPLVCQNKDKCHEEDSDLIKHEVEEVMPEYSGDQVFALPLGDLPSQQDLKLLCSQQDWCHATNNVQLSSQEDDHFQTTEVTEDFRGEDNLHNLAEVTLDVNPPDLHEHQPQDEHKDNGFAPTQDDKGEVVGSCGVDCEETSNYVASLNQSAESAKGDEGKDANLETSDVYLPNLTSADQPQSEEGKDEVAPVLAVLEPNVADEIASGEVVVLAEESERVEASCSEDPQSDGSESQDVLDTNGNPSTDAPVCDEPSFRSSVLPLPDPSDQIPNAAFPDVGSSGTFGMTGFNSQISSLSESHLTQSLSGFGGESGISSMAVSPDLSEALEFGTTPDHMPPSPMDFHPYSEEQPESQVTFTRDEAEAFNVGRVGVEPPLNPVEQTSQDWAMDSSFAVNEDMFGNDIEDGYYSGMGQLIAAKTMNLTEIAKVSDDAPVLVAQVDGKEGAKSKEGEEECEKTEISIMEATMDNNEWITDGNYQVLPWMNVSAGTFPLNSSKTEPSPDVHPLSLPDDTNLETNIPPSCEASQTDTLSLEESVDGSKKILAVQPMPQNVNVTFLIHYVTQSPYQKLAVTGNHDELGNWKEFILLEKAKDGQWATVVSLPAESHVEWKFVVLEKGGVCRWEECGNRLLETGCGEDLLVHKWWGFL